MSSIKDLAVSGHRVLVRCDFNVPLENSEITDDRRITEALPTIKYLLENRAAVILCSHMGRPNGVTPEFSLAPVRSKIKRAPEPRRSPPPRLRRTGGGDRLQEPQAGPSRSPRKRSISPRGRKERSFVRAATREPRRCLC